MFVLLLLLGFAMAEGISVDDPHQRAVRVRVETAARTELVGTVLTVCGSPEVAPKEVVCEEQVVKSGGLDLVLHSEAQYTLRAHLDGFLVTTIGPIVVKKWHYPPSELLIVLNPDIQE